MSVTLALPSKGRLKEQTLAVLEKAGYKVILPDDDRNYRARVEGEDDLDILFLSASEIARELGYGSVDMGVTGKTSCARHWPTLTSAWPSRRNWASATPMSSSRCRKSGAM